MTIEANEQVALMGKVIKPAEVIKLLGKFNCNFLESLTT